MSVASREPDLQPLVFEGRAMGSPLRLSVVPEPGPAATRRAAAAWVGVREEFEACEQAMSRFRASSEITGLNRQAGEGVPAMVSRRLSLALAASDRAHRITGGRFDPRVLSDLERLGDRGAPLGPIGAEATGRRPPDGSRIVERVSGERIRLPRPVDLGGIGKGLALRWAGATVRRLGVASFLLDAGGDIIACGAAPGGGPWQVGLEDPAGGAEPVVVVEASDAAVATSSVRRRRWRADGREVHHLIDPRTGKPGGAGLLAVTVAGPDPAWAEVWSKTLFLEGRAGIAALARRRDLAAWWVAADGSIEMTAAGRLRTVWTAGEHH